MKRQKRDQVNDAFGEDLEAGSPGLWSRLPVLIMMTESMEKLRKKHQELQEYIRKQEEMQKVRNLFLKQVMTATRKAQPVMTGRIKEYKTEGIDKMRQRPVSSKKYNLLKVLEMMN